jgi:hypothetical protein
VLETLQAVGAIAGAVLAVVFAQCIGAGRVLWGALVAIGALILVYARLTDIAPALALVAFFGVATAALSISVGPLLLHVTPREYIGRVASLRMPVATCASLLSVATAGYLASSVLNGFSATISGVTLGPLDTIFSVAGTLIIAGGVYAMIGLRGVRLAREEQQQG